eukprot:1334912-Amorphochlora_amoeboformis.AAC.1
MSLSGTFDSSTLLGYGAAWVRVRVREKLRVRVSLVSDYSTCLSPRTIVLFGLGGLALGLGLLALKKHRCPHI